MTEPEHTTHIWFKRKTISNRFYLNKLFFLYFKPFWAKYKKPFWAKYILECFKNLCCWVDTRDFNDLVQDIFNYSGPLSPNLVQFAVI